MPFSAPPLTTGCTELTLYNFNTRRFLDIRVVNNANFASPEAEAPVEHPSGTAERVWPRGASAGAGHFPAQDACAVRAACTPSERL